MALIWDGEDQRHWVPVSKASPQARRMADRHYSYRGPRDRPASNEIGPPGQKIVLLTPDNRALWGSHRPAPASGLKRPDGILAHCCFIYRNEGYRRALSSELIREAVGRTASLWGIAPQGFVTYVAESKVRSPNPGYCFLMAGFERDGYAQSHYLGRLRRLIMPPEAVEDCLTTFERVLVTAED